MVPQLFQVVAAQVATESLLLNDLCPEMKECLTDLLPQDTVQFIPGDAEALDFPEKDGFNHFLLYFAMVQ